MKLLHIDASILGQNSVSHVISAAAATRLEQLNPGIEVIHRDLATAPISHLSGAYLAGQKPEVQHDQALQADLDLGGNTLAEFLASDIIVVGCPMYNFTIPSQLKAWVDRVLVAGKTFRYTPAGPEGLAGDKRVVLAISRGGVYSPGAPAAPAEHAESYLRAVFGFMGIRRIDALIAEGVALGPDQRKKALEAAVAQASQLT